MTATGQAIGAATAFIWLGMVLAISFLEAPLKFRAPGITLPLGLGIGRLVFRTLNAAEIAFSVVLLAAMTASRPIATIWVLLAIVGALLAAQTGLLRPRLDRRAGQITTGQSPSSSRLHLAYVALEVLKVTSLVTLGTLLITSS